MSERPAPLQTGSRPDPPASPLPSAEPRRGWLPWLIVGGVVVVFALVVGAGLALSAALSTRFGFRAPDQPLLQGEPGSPVAVQPLECSDSCFGEDSVDALLSSPAAFGALGVPDNTFPRGTYAPMPAGELYVGDLASWRAYFGGPDACFFAPTSAPYAPALDAANDSSEDLVYFMGTHEDLERRESADQSVRVFPDSSSAETYLSALASSITDCSILEIGPANNRYSAAVSPTPALDLPDTVAAVGWVRTGDPGVRWRAYVIDMQYGNLVVRNRLLTDGSATEAAFRRFAEDYAKQLATIEPTIAAPG